MSTQTQVNWDQEEIDRIIRLISDLNDEVKDLRGRIRSCEVDIEGLERHKADA